MIGSYLIFAVLGFILISTFTAHYNQNYLEQYYAAALRRESSQIADPVTIVQLTDLHGASFGAKNFKNRLRLSAVIWMRTSILSPLVVVS